MKKFSVILISLLMPFFMYSYDKCFEVVFEVNDEFTKSYGTTALSGKIYTRTTSEDAKVILLENGFDEASIELLYIPKLLQAPWVLVPESSADTPSAFFLNEEIKKEDVGEENMMFMSMYVDNETVNVLSEYKLKGDKVFSRFIPLFF